MKLIVCMSLFLISTGNCFASQTEYKTIKSVINAFEQSIKDKDKSRFLNLFVDTSSPMIGVVSEESMVGRRAAVEKINKADNKNFVATRTWEVLPTEMIDRIVSSKVSSREEFDNIKIVSDGNIANVYFDYVKDLRGSVASKHYGFDIIDLTTSTQQYFKLTYQYTFEDVKESFNLVKQLQVPVNKYNNLQWQFATSSDRSKSFSYGLQWHKGEYFQGSMDYKAIDITTNINRFIKENAN